MATLTGAIRIALGQHYTGLSAGRAASSTPSAAPATRTNDWPMPLSDEYRDNMKGSGRPAQQRRRLGSAINGAAFIEAGLEPSTEWAHLDIASSGWSRRIDPIRPRARKVAVRTLVELAAPAAPSKCCQQNTAASLRPNRNFGKMWRCCTVATLEGPMKRSISIALAIAGLLVGLAPVTVLAEGGLTISTPIRR